MKMLLTLSFLAMSSVTASAQTFEAADHCIFGQSKIWKMAFALRHKEEANIKSYVRLTKTFKFTPVPAVDPQPEKIGERNTFFYQMPGTSLSVFVSSDVPTERQAVYKAGFKREFTSNYVTGDSGTEVDTLRIKASGFNMTISWNDIENSDGSTITATKLYHFLKKKGIVLEMFNRKDDKACYLDPMNIETEVFSELKTVSEEAGV